MRFAVFHSMLAVSIGFAVTGVALGVQARCGSVEDELAGPHRVAHDDSLPRVPVERSVVPPMPVAPRFGAAVSAPTLSWLLSEGTDGARVELCPTNDFDLRTTRHLDVDGEQIALPSPWPTGVWYWRLRGRTGGVVGDRATPTWMVYVGEATSASLDLSARGGALALNASPGAGPPPPFVPTNNDGDRDPDWYTKVTALVDEARRPAPRAGN